MKCMGFYQLILNCAPDTQIQYTFFAEKAISKQLLFHFPPSMEWSCLLRILSSELLLSI